MTLPKQQHVHADGDPANAVPPMHDEADIGSGENTPAQLDTEERIREIPPLPADRAPPPQPA
jgi:hypothetical protein